MSTAYCLLFLMAGCSKPAADRGKTPAEMPLAGVKLRLLVVDDAELQTAVQRLQGEWNERTGSDYQVESIRESELAHLEALAADAVIGPSHQLGLLAGRKLIAPMPKEMLAAGGGDWSDIFELLTLREASWGTQVMGVPFGSPVLICYYRADMLQELGRRPPQSWTEYGKLAELLGQTPHDDTAAWSGTLEPLGPGWAGVVLLARAAAYAKHRENYSALFDIRSMEPLVDGPPFVRALEELVATAKAGAAEQLQFDPPAVRKGFWQGQSAMALTWPTGAAGSLPAEIDVSDSEIRVGFVELPGSMDVYNVGHQAWERRPDDEDPHVPLLTVAGRMGVVSAKSGHRQAAFQLLLWLCGNEVSPQVCPASRATTLFRHSQVKMPQAWVEKPAAAAATQYGEVTEKTFQREQWLFAPRIPGRAEYMSALDVAVQQAVRGEQSPAEALRQAATRWREITAGRGVQRQKAAYLHSLGLN